MDDKLIQAAATAIKHYLTERPAAADTLEGIHSYWIEWQGIPELMAVTEAALMQLQHAGFVECRMAGNRLIWRRRAIGLTANGTRQR